MEIIRNGNNHVHGVLGENIENNSIRNAVHKTVMTVFKQRPWFMFQNGHFSKPCKSAQNHAHCTLFMIENDNHDEWIQKLSQKVDFSKISKKCIGKCSKMAENREI